MRTLYGIAFGVSLLSLVACQKQEPAPKPREEPAKAPTSNIDPEIAAVASAAAAAPAGQLPGADDAGPPPDGILTLAKADAELRRLEPPKVVLGSDGSAPRVLLAASAPQEKQEGSIQIVLQSDPRAGALPIEFTVQIVQVKPKAEVRAPAPAPAPAASGAVNAAAVPAASPMDVVLTIKTAKLDVPAGPEADELNKKFAKLKGATLTFTRAPNGATSNYRTELPKGAGDEYLEIVRTLSEGLTTTLVPFPDKPVGNGAFWMVTSREQVMGLDVVSYRMVKVTQVSGASVELSLNVKRYVAGAAFEVPGVAAQGPMEIGRFEANAEGTLQVVPSRFIPSGKLDLGLAAMLKPNAVYQSQSAITLNFGGPTATPATAASPAGASPVAPAPAAKSPLQ